MALKLNNNKKSKSEYAMVNIQILLPVIMLEGLYLNISFTKLSI